MNDAAATPVSVSKGALRRLEPLAPYAVAAFKLAVSAFFLHEYVARFLRIMYIADDPARGIEAYRLAYGGFTLFPSHQFAPLPLWIWAALLRIWPDIYWTGTAINVLAGAGVAAFLYLLGKRLAGPAAGFTAALFFTFSPVHHNLTLSMGMAEPIFYLGLTAGLFFAARAEAGLRGAAAAGFCFAAAALTRYEATLFLGLYAVYRLVRRRPGDAAAWLLWAAPLALAAAFLGPKAFIGTHHGLWPALAGVKADTTAVLPNPTWYRRLGYGFWRVLFDGRAATVLAFAGATLVWFRPWRRADRIMIWCGPAIIFAGLVVIAGVVGVGFCPERYFATPLMLFFPFAGLAVAALLKAAVSAVRTFAVALVLLAAGVVTVGWDQIILKPGYGYTGAATTAPVFAAETALKLRALWRSGEMAPDEVVIIETGEKLFDDYPLRAYTDHPLNFKREPGDLLRDEFPGFGWHLRLNRARVAIILSPASREAVKKNINKICKDSVVYENPTHTVIVLREGWRKVPDFSSDFRRDLVVVHVRESVAPKPGEKWLPDVPAGTAQ